MAENGEVKQTANQTIMHIDLDAFFVSVEQVLNPDLKGKPVVVGGNPEGRGVVAAASYEARAFGLHSGMPLKTASRLCPQAIFIQGGFNKYRDASRKFMALLADFTPFIEPVSLDEAYLDVTGFESLHGSIHQMAIKIKQQIKQELGINASVGISGSKVVAKVASEQSKPDGLLEVPQGKEREFLAPLPIAELPGIGKKTEQSLKKWGINTLGKLADTPLSTLQGYFGNYGESLHRLSRGIDHRKVEPPGRAKSISRETTFNEDTRDNQKLKATLRYISERVGADLRKRERRARSVTLKLRYADFSTITRSHTLTNATDNDKTLSDTGIRMLEKELSTGKQPVRLIGFKVSNLAEPSRQLDMLDSSTGRQEQLDKVIDRIRQKYGFTSIQTGQTIQLKDISRQRDDGYSANEPSLSR